MINMEYLRKVFNRKQNIWLIISGIVLCLFLIILLIGVKLSKTMDAQMAAKRWSEDNDCTQISIFFSELAGIDENSIKELDYTIDSKLDEDSIMASSSNGRRRVSAYSAIGQVTIASQAESMTVKAIGCGGDFFLFHPMKLISGSYFAGNDVMQDYVVIDEDAAWKLFGSYDVVGQAIEISGKRNIITGVIERDTGRLNKLAGNNESTIYLSYETLKYNHIVTGINCYEVLLPNPVDGYGKEIVKKSVSQDELRYDLMENTGRFNWTRLIVRFKTMGSRSMNSKTVVFPYWENMARGMEDVLTPLCFMAVLMAAFVIVNLSVLAVRFYTNRTIHKSDIKKFIEHRIEVHRINKKKKIEEGDFI